MEYTKRYKLHMDTIGFHFKPGTAKSGAVNKLVPRVSHNVFEVTKEELVEKVLSGFSIIPGLCDMTDRKAWQGALQKDWSQQDIFALDFDNGCVTKQQVINRFEELGIPVFFVHDTYSSSEEKEKFHVFFCAKETVTDVLLRDQFQAIIMSAFAADVDRKCRNRNRYFNGTNKNQEGAYYVDYSAEVDVQATVEKYWEGSALQLLFIPKDSELLKTTRVTGEKQKESKERKTVEREVHENVTYILVSEEYFVDRLPSTYNGIYKRNMQVHYAPFMEIVEKLLSTRQYVDGSGRHDLLFVTFCMVAFKFGSREAYRVCKIINWERFEEPLSIKEFNYTVLGAYEHIEENFTDWHNTSYIYKFKTTLVKLKVPKELVEGLPYFENLANREHADAYRGLKKERDLYIEQLMRKGYGARRIAKLVKEEYGYDEELCLGLSGVQYVMRKIRAAESVSGVSEITQYTSATTLSPLSEGENKQESSVAEGENREDIPSTATIIEKKEIEKDSPAVEETNTSSPSTATDSEEDKKKEGGLNKEQQEAFNLAVEGVNVEILARAGTGKSYTLASIKAALEEKGKTVAVCAATGLAAQTVGGTTVHNLFGIKPGEYYKPYKILLSKILKTDVVIIDEIGMVDEETFEAVCMALYTCEFTYNHGIQLIIAGDPLQLQPVSGSYYFESDLHFAMGFHTVNLYQNMRQIDVRYASLVGRVGEGDRSAAHELNCICKHDEDSNELYLYARKSQVLQKNLEVLNSLPGELIRLDEHLTIKLGAKVVVTANAKADASGKQRYYNGLRGTVVKVGKRTVIIETNDGRTVAIRRQKIQTENGSYEGYPLLLGYALTIHKTQGMTLEAANIHPSCFADGQLYTALSRVRTAAGVHLLAPIKEWDVRVSKKALAFVNGTCKREDYGDELMRA